MEMNDTTYTTTSTLTVENIDTSGEGVYTCVASNGIREDQQANATVTVQSKPLTYHLPISVVLLTNIGNSTAVPVIVDSPQPVVAITDDEASFSCSARGKSTPTITWWRNGTQLTSDEAFTVSTSDAIDEEYTAISTLTIVAVALEDEAYYTCIAANAAGRNNASAALTVQSK